MAAAIVYDKNGNELRVGDRVEYILDGDGPMVFKGIYVCDPVVHTHPDEKHRHVALIGIVYDTPRMTELGIEYLSSSSIVRIGASTKEELLTHWNDRVRRLAINGGPLGLWVR